MCERRKHLEEVKLYLFDVERRELEKRTFEGNKNVKQRDRLEEDKI